CTLRDIRILDVFDSLQFDQVHLVHDFGERYVLSVSLPADLLVTLCEHVGILRCQPSSQIVDEIAGASLKLLVVKFLMMGSVRVAPRLRVDGSRDGIPMSLNPVKQLNRQHDCRLGVSRQAPLPWTLGFNYRAAGREMESSPFRCDLN